MVRFLLSFVLLLSISPLMANSDAPHPGEPAESSNKRTLIAERIVTIDGQPTVLQVEIQAPSIDQDRDYSDEELLAILKRHVGRWYGKTRISLIDGRQIAAMTTEQTFRMESRDNGRPVLRGTGIYATDGRLSHAFSESWIENNTLISRIEEQENKQTYVGRVQDSGETITWLPVVTEGEPHTEQITQYFTDHQGQPGLITLGFRQHIRPEYETLLIIRGELFADNDGREAKNHSGDTSGGQVRGRLQRPPVEAEGN